MQVSAILRIISVFIITFSVLAYNTGSAIISSAEIEEKSFIGGTSGQDILEEEKNETIIDKEKKEENVNIETKKEETASTVVSAEAVKGKIISKYVSPYSTGLSYNNVYVKNSTGLNIDLKSMLESGLGYKIEKNSEPQVLIMHTHTTETFMSSDSEYYTETYTSRTTDNSKNMAEIGRIVAEKLNSAGIKTLHDTTQHDYPQYSGSYTRSAKTVNSYIKKYPSIKIVLDLHRDAISAGGNDKTKLVTEINGKKAAQIMLVMGSQSGSVTNFPNWKENLKLALKLQQTFEVKYPTLARPLSLMSKNYNQSLTNGSLLIEFGTDANSLDEAKYSAEMVGDCLVTLLNNLG